MKGTTKSGLHFEVSDELYDDAEFVEMLSNLEASGGVDFFKVMEKMLGAVGKKALYDHLRDENGKVSMKKVTDEVKEIFELLTGTVKGKN